MAEEPLREPAREPASAADIGLPEIPGYRIEETLGRGSTGVVYRATQLAVDREVALKVLHPDLAGRPRAVRRLQREARTAARLAHPNIVSAIDMGQVGPLWWYAMELVIGESLAERLKRVGHLAEREALRLFTPLVDALDHAFQQGVVHRDIKPANILIDRGGRARLVDLGLAFREDDPLITSPGSTLGTPHYVSPEQARNPGQADARSDIWSLGATLYHAVCGRPPFAGESVAEILSGVLYGRVSEPRELVPELSRSLSLVLRKCLSRDPQKRYQTPRELLEDLERCREKRAVLVQAYALDPVRSSSAWRARVPWIAGAALVALAGFLGAWLARDVLAPADRPSEIEAAAAPWPALEELAAAGGRPEERPAPLLVRLAALGPVTSRHRARYQMVEETLAARLREAQDAFVRRLRSDVERLVSQRDFVGALAVLGAPGFGERARAELSLDSEQLDQLERVAPLAELRERVADELDRHAGQLAARAEDHVEQALDARVANDVRAGRWRKARQQLSAEPQELLEQAGLVLAGLPRERIERLEAGLRAALEERRAALADAWRHLDQELADWTLAEARRLEVELRARNLPGPIDQELARLAAARAAELRVAPNESLPQVSALAAQALDLESARLLELERTLLEDDARAWLAEEERRAGELLRERRYEALVELWRRALDRDWLGPVHYQVEVHLRAAELLDGLLERAARGVLARNGERLSILRGSIAVEGRLAAGGDPLREPFSLETPDVGSVAFALRLLPQGGAGAPHVLAPEALERFADLPGDPAATADPADRLARALLRFHEGDTAGALACLPIGLTGDPLLDELAVRLETEVSRRDVELRAQREQRAAEASKRVAVALRMAAGAREPADREAAARGIDELLASYGDTQPVRARELELRDLRRKLGQGRAVELRDLEERFGATSARLEGGAAELAFELGADDRGGWTPGDWSAGAEGWIASAPRALDDLAVQEGWPKLELGAPLDLGEPFEVAITFEQPQASGPPRLLVISAAGVHVGLRGGQGGMGPRVHFGTGGHEALRRLLGEVDRPGEGRAFRGLARGERYTLSVELSRKRGQARVRLWGLDAAGSDFAGATIAELALMRLPEGAGAAEVVVRSLEPVRLRAATVRARALRSY